MDCRYLGITLMRKQELFDMIYSVCEECHRIYGKCSWKELICPMVTLVDRIEERFKK